MEITENNIPNLTKVLNMNLLLNRMNIRFTYCNILYDAVKKEYPYGYQSSIDLYCLREIFTKEFTYNFDKPLDEKDYLALKYLVLDDLNLCTLDFISKCKNIEIIQCRWDNLIDSLRPLSNLTSLRKCNFDTVHRSGGNAISDLRSLSKLTQLEYLSLANNTVFDLSPIKDLKELSYLNIHNNKVTNISCLGQLINLKHLDITFNTVNTGDIVEIKQKLPDCDIYASYIFFETQRYQDGIITQIKIHNIDLVCWVGYDIENWELDINIGGTNSTHTMDIVILEKQTLDSNNFTKEEVISYIQRFAKGHLIKVNSPRQALEIEQITISRSSNNIFHICFKDDSPIVI